MVIIVDKMLQVDPNFISILNQRMLYPAILFNWSECKGSDLSEDFRRDLI